MKKNIIAKQNEPVNEARIAEMSYDKIRAEYPHETNMFMYAGLAIFFAFGAYKEFRAIPNE